MVNYDTAESILLNSVDSLISKNEGLKKGDLITEINNVICLYILNSQRKEASKATTIDDMLRNMLQDMQENNYIETTQVFSKAALTLFPQYFNEKDRAMMAFSVQESLSNPNQWELLKAYFYKFHHLNVDDLE